MWFVVGYIHGGDSFQTRAFSSEEDARSYFEYTIRYGHYRKLIMYKGQEANSWTSTSQSYEH